MNEIDRAPAKIDYKAHTKEVQRIAEIIKSFGAGAPTKYAEIATSAFAGNANAKAEIERLIGRPVETMLDVYEVLSAAYDVMAPTEASANHNRAEQRLSVLHDPKHDADAYLANKLGNLRREAGLTQTELSKRSGVNLSTLQKLENGTNRILGARTDINIKIAAALNTTIDNLICIDNNDID